MLWFVDRKFGKVTIEIDRVVMVGELADEYTLLPTSKSGQPRNLEVELTNQALLRKVRVTFKYWENLLLRSLLYI